MGIPVARQLVEAVLFVLGAHKTKIIKNAKATNKENFIKPS